MGEVKKKIIYDETTARDKRNYISLLLKCIIDQCERGNFIEERFQNDFLIGIAVWYDIIHNPKDFLYKDDGSHIYKKENCQ